MKQRDCEPTVGWAGLSSFDPLGFIWRTIWILVGQSPDAFSANEQDMLRLIRFCVQTGALMKIDRRIFLCQILIGIVTLINLDCAVVFLINPSGYAPGFELSGPVGVSIVRGFGVLFLMWNVPYVVAVWNPLRNVVSVMQAALMQAIGLFGESIIWAGLPVVHVNARATIGRFVLFDGGGLVAILAALWILQRVRKSSAGEV